MIIYKSGNILQATENIICHQVNENAIMGGGLALQIAKVHPNIEKEYKEFCKHFKDKKMLYGKYQICDIKGKKYIANCFTQRNFNTNLVDIKIVFNSLLKFCKKNNFTVCIPFKYGCGIANGNWKEVSKLFEGLSEKCCIDISVYKLGKED